MSSCSVCILFFFNDTATTEIYTLSLHDALPIWTRAQTGVEMEALTAAAVAALTVYDMVKGLEKGVEVAEVVLLSRSEEHTSELQSRQYLVCRLLLEKKKKKRNNIHYCLLYSQNE